MIKDYGREYKRSDYNLNQNMPPAEVPVDPNTINPAAVNVGVTPAGDPNAGAMVAMANPVDELKAKNKQIQQDVSEQKGGYDPNSANSVQQKEMEKRRQELIKRLQERQTQGSALVKDYGREYKKSSKV